MNVNRPKQFVVTLSTNRILAKQQKHNKDYLKLRLHNSYDMTKLQCLLYYAVSACNAVISVG